MLLRCLNKGKVCGYSWLTSAKCWKFSSYFFRYSSQKPSLKVTNCIDSALAFGQLFQTTSVSRVLIISVHSCCLDKILRLYTYARHK